MPLRQLPRAGSVVVSPLPDVGQYVYPISAASTGTSNALGNGTLRLAPWLLPQPMKLDRLGADVATVGEAGSKFRMGLYADTGNMRPGALLVDAGQIAGDSATVQDLTVDVWLPAGVIWIGGAVQAVVTSQPTMRTTNAWQPDYPVGWASTPSAGTATFGWSQTGVTGALPSTFSGTGNAGNMPRLHVRRG